MSVTYIKGKDNIITDYLSRVLVTLDSIKLLILQVHYTTATLNCTPDRVQQLCESTQKDDTLTLLKEIIIQGWPASTKELPPELYPYWTFCESITVADGLLLKGNRIIIPECERKQILDQIYHGHLLEFKNASSTPSLLSTGQGFMLSWRILSPTTRFAWSTLLPTGKIPNRLDHN